MPKPAFIALYRKLPVSNARVVLDKGEWVVIQSYTGFHSLWHRHDDRYGGGRNGPPYLARCDVTRCLDCPAPVPVETQGFLELANWER